MYQLVQLEDEERLQVLSEISKAEQQTEQLEKLMALQLQDVKKDDITLSQEKLQEKEKEIEKLKQQLVLSYEEDQLNEFGIMKNSICILKIVKVENLPTSNFFTSASPYFKIQFENQILQTQVGNSKSQIFNCEFQLRVEKGQQPIQIICMEKNQFTTDDVIGISNLELKNYKDQIKQDI